MAKVPDKMREEFHAKALRLRNGRQGLDIAGCVIFRGQGLIRRMEHVSPISPISAQKSWRPLRKPWRLRVKLFSYLKKERSNCRRPKPKATTRVHSVE
jgi:hypothetical protein